MFCTVHTALFRAVVITYRELEKIRTCLRDPQGIAPDVRDYTQKTGKNWISLHGPHGIAPGDRDYTQKTGNKRNLSAWSTKGCSGRP